MAAHRDLTVAALVSSSGVARGTVERLHEGRTEEPGVGTVRRLADALGVAPEWLAWGRGQGPSEWVEAAP